MKTVILYRSKHHGNTKKLVDAVVANFDNVDAIDVAALGKNEYPDLDEYPLVGIATGIYYGKIDETAYRPPNASGAQSPPIADDITRFRPPMRLPAIIL